MCPIKSPRGSFDVVLTLLHSVPSRPSATACTLVHRRTTAVDVVATLRSPLGDGGPKGWTPYPRPITEGPRTVSNKLPTGTSQNRGTVNVDGRTLWGSVSVRLRSLTPGPGPRSHPHPSYDGPVYSVQVLPTTT